MLDDAQLLFENARYDSAINRAYYCIFNSILSVLVLDDINTTQHKNAIAMFNKEYIHIKMVFEKRTGSMLNHAYITRNQCDYRRLRDATKEECEDIMNFAQEFYTLISEYRKHRVE